MSIAFFDVDGTLLPHPSMERRFFWELFRRGEIPAANCLLWTSETLKRSLAGLAKTVQSNKTYLRNISSNLFASPANSADTRRWMPEFFPAAVRRVRWHALHGEKIVLVTGTLAPLAEIVKTALERELLLSGVDTTIHSIATELESSSGRWTGRVIGMPMFGEAKARAIQLFSRSYKTPLTQCTAYGDHALDHWMLASVGHPTVVNPSGTMRRIARSNRWKIENWTACPVESRHIPHVLKWKGEVER